MDSNVIGELIPIVAILATFGCPVGIVFVLKHFAFKHRELEAELEARKMLSNRDRAELEKRIERLESVVMGARVAGAVAPLAPASASSALYEPPPSTPSEPSGAPEGTRQKS